MESAFEKYKGIHPGIILARELGQRQMKKAPFALSLNEYPQVLNDITKGRRGLTPSLSLKIDQALGLEEGTMFILQAHYEIKKEKEKSEFKQQPDRSVLRDILFWDTDINKIDWQKQYKAIIVRVFERGSDEEKQEILRFYGEQKIKTVTGSKEIRGNSLSIMSNIK